jgi:hypothetical protein
MKDLVERVENLVVLILLVIAVTWASIQIAQLEKKVVLLEKDNIELHQKIDSLILLQRKM